MTGSFTREQTLATPSGAQQVGLFMFLAVLAAVFLPRNAAAAEPLRYKFKPGEVFRYTLVQDQKQQTRIAGAEMTNSAFQTVDMHRTVLGVDATGVAEISQTIDRIRWKLTSPGGSLNLDSAEANVSNSPIAAQLVPLMKALSGAEFRFKMDDRGEMTDIRVPKSLLDSIQQANPGAATGGMFSEEGLKNLIAQSRLVLPKGPIEKGATWDDQSRISQADFGTTVMDKHYTFQGPSGKAPQIATFTLASDLKVEPAPGASGSVKIDFYEGKGEFSFDTEAGRIISTQVSEKLESTTSVKDPQSGQLQSIRQVTQTVNTMNLATN